MSHSPSRPRQLPSRPDDERTRRERIAALCVEGWRLWDRFDATTVERPFHPFVAADYDVVREALLPHPGEGRRFLEWGSATGVITIMADLLGYEAFGIELDGNLTTVAQELATQFDSGARFVTGSFLPAGYTWRSGNGDTRTGTLGQGRSGYQELGMPLDDFEVVFGYPWDGEIATMLDLMHRHGHEDALLLINSLSDGVVGYRSGRVVSPADWFPGRPSPG
ncbi:MAG TPA: hypothetical protein VFN22_09905 [Gemmatimonadales bacterium]|nr:hypothetical protein [Gemmatimonadales bacterium]